ncbi:hypothetical protein, partial [Pseudomonas jessenii]|uniref:hypothetical protein n=1 Tax=Pseudomonas jessenii TaxID=77298 RepID=UPI0019D4B3C0
ADFFNTIGQKWTVAAYEKPERLTIAFRRKNKKVNDQSESLAMRSAKMCLIVGCPSGAIQRPEKLTQSETQSRKRYKSIYFNFSSILSSCLFSQQLADFPCNLQFHHRHKLSPLQVLRGCQTFFQNLLYQNSTASGWFG